MKTFLTIVLLLVANLTSYGPPISHDEYEKAIERGKIVASIRAYEAKNRHIQRITAVIKHIESRGNYHKPGSLGEIGAYQFMPKTWKKNCNRFAGKYLKPTKENQDFIAYKDIERLVNKGYSVSQIASIWNSGLPNCTKIGVATNAKGDTLLNSKGQPIAFNVPHYRKTFVRLYKTIKV